MGPSTLRTVFSWLNEASTLFGLFHRVDLCGLPKEFVCKAMSQLTCGRFFDKMFRSNMVECSQMRIKLRELKGPVLLQLLRYLYCKTITIQSTDEALALVAAGSQFLVQGAPISATCIVYPLCSIIASYKAD